MEVMTLKAGELGLPMMADGGASRGCLFFGPLTSVVSRPGVTDLAVTAQGRVWVDQGQGMVECDPAVPFRSPQIVRDYAVQLCAQLGRRLDDACPIADASSVDGTRVHAIIAPLVPVGAEISIRLPSPVGADLSTLSRAGLFPQPWLALFAGLVQRRATILITGGTGVGKTTLLKALIGQCVPGERIISIEEVRELGDIGHGNHVSLISREANVEGAGAVGLGELVKATLRMRPDRVILGECRGEEITDLLRAFNCGHRGGMVTMHADRITRVPSRLIALGMLGGLQPSVLAMLASDAFDVVIHLERSHGCRYVAQLGVIRINGQGELVGEVLASWNGRDDSVLSPAWQAFVDTWTKTEEA